jgi:glutathione S-transferase
MASPKKCTFYDLKHSNNSARVRLWLRLNGSLLEHIETVVLVHDDMDDGGKLADINPLKKVPVFITDTGLKLYESFVIISYLEDRFGGQADGPKLMMDTPDDRAFVQLLVRIHDIYISSPNCTQPHFSHTQGCMYLDPVPTKYTPARRTMPDPIVRASKLKEIWERLNWLETTIRLPFMAGERISHADLTWFPTCIFMEVLLPYVFSWTKIFHEYEYFPRLSQWFKTCCANVHFASVHDDIYGVLIKQKQDGRFDGVREVVKSNSDLQWKYM